MVTQVSWKATAGGDWATAANWSGGALPNSADAVTIATATVETITHNSGNDVIYSLAVGQDYFQLNGGSLDILTTATFNDSYTQTGGTLTAHAVSIAGSGTLVGGSATGSTVLSITGAIALGNYTLAGGAQLNNAATTNQTAGITVGDATGVDAGINNAAKGTYRIAGDFGISGGASSATFINAGTLEKTNGSATSNIGIDITNTGTISVATGGTLEFDGPNNVLGGTIGGLGTVAFGGTGKTQLTAGTITVGGLAIVGGASVTLGTNTVLHGVFTEAASFGTTLLDLGSDNFTITGARSSISASSGNATVTGTGTFANAGTLTLESVTFGGALTVANTGLILQTNTISLSDSAGGLASLVNAAGATYEFSQDVNLNIGGNTATSFSNNGTLEKTASLGTSNVAADVSNAASATILAVSGTLSFSNMLSNAGTIRGQGAVQLVGGATGTLAAGTALQVANFAVLGSASLNLATNVSYVGVFTEAASFGSTVVELNAFTLALNGAKDSISGSEGEAFVTGTGTLSNAGTLSVGELTLGQTATLLNTGTVDQAGGVTIGDGSGASALIDNAAHAVWKLVNTSGIVNGAASTSAFENFGTLDATPGAGSTVTLSTTLTNEAGGTIIDATGTLDLNGILVNDGTIGGTQVQLVGSGTTTLGAGTVLNVASLGLENAANLTLGTNITYGGTFTDAASFGTDDINLAGHALTLSGPAFFSGSEGNAAISGGGMLLLKGATQLGQVILGGSSLLANTGTLTALGGLQIGDGSGEQAALTNTGTYNLVNDSGITEGSSLLSDFSNSGLFEKTAGTGTSVISAAFTNTGTITVTSGTLEFVAGTLHNTGTINGVVTTDTQGNIFITHH